MTKTGFAQPDAKLNQVVPIPEYTAVQLSGNGDAINQADHSRQSRVTCWYVFGILSTIFCCLPCGVIGLVHAMIAKHEGERGNYAAHRHRLRQAKCWISWSITLGLLIVLSTVVWVIVKYGVVDSVGGWCGNAFYDMYDYGYVSGNMTELLNNTSTMYPTALY